MHIWRWISSDALPLHCLQLAGTSNLAIKVSCLTELATQYPPQAATMLPHRCFEQLEV